MKFTFGARFYCSSRGLCSSPVSLNPTYNSAWPQTNANVLLQFQCQNVK